MEAWLAHEKKREQDALESARDADFIAQAERLAIAQKKFEYEADAQAARVRFNEQGHLPEITDEEKKLAVFAFLERVEEQEKNIADALKRLGYMKGGTYDWAWSKTTKPASPFELFALQVSVQNAAICGAAMEMLILCQLQGGTPQRAIEIAEEYKQRVEKRKADTDAVVPSLAKVPALAPAAKAPTKKDCCTCGAKSGTCITSRCPCHKGGLPCGTGCRCNIIACNAVWQADVARGKSPGTPPV